MAGPNGTKDKQEAKIQELVSEIGLLETRIADLNAEWKPFASLQPISGYVVGGGPFDPTRRLQGLQLAIDIDAANAEAQGLRAQRAALLLYALADPTQTEKDEQAVLKAQDAARLAREALRDANRTLATAAEAQDRRQERVRSLELEREAADLAQQRWLAEKSKDEAEFNDLERESERFALNTAFAG